jgi:DNA (cytosine-5)-methyltransferase 1
VDHTKKLSHLGLCSGYGGIERGIALTGTELRSLAHVEIEAYAIANLVAKMESGELAPCPIWTDLKTLPLEPFRGSVDLLTGGYPCQPFSLAGKRLGKDDPRHLWPYILKIIDGIMPGMCFFENVEGHVSNGLRQVLADLEARGYETSWGIFSASEVGAPHRRKRVFIMADSSGTRLQGFRGTPEFSLSKEWEREEGHIAPCRRQFPARQSEQYGWEKPRTNQPNLGGTTDGSSNRVDQLRLLGNGVVPQTAALAWRTLCQKQL